MHDRHGHKGFAADDDISEWIIFEVGVLSNTG
jgi:hypothetical protein